MAATCRETLTWPDGTNKPGRATGEHDCAYMRSLVRKHVSPELWWRRDKELRYQPWAGQDTVQTADILDITAEAPAGALLRRSSPKTSPEILKTLRWIQNTLADEQTMFFLEDGKTLKRRNFADVDGCQVTFVHEWLDEEKVTFAGRSQVNLAVFVYRVGPLPSRCLASLTNG